MMATTCNNIEANFTPQSFQLRQAIRTGRITEHNAIFIYYLTQLVAEVWAKISLLILHKPESTNAIAAQPNQCNTVNDQLPASQILPFSYLSTSNKHTALMTAVNWTLLPFSHS